MALTLKHTVIHGFTKLANTLVIGEVVKKDVLLNNSLAGVVSLVEGVAKLIGTTGSNVMWGQFANNMREGTFPSGFHSYTTTLSEDDFMRLSHAVVDEMVAQAKEQKLATGGNILLSHYEQNGSAYFLVAMIKQRGGVTLNADYVPEEIVEVDLSKIHQAARINFQRYSDVASSSDLEQDDDDVDDPAEDKTYLCFIGQNSNNVASGYFVKALGCTKGIASSRATNNAIVSVEKYFKDNAQLKEYKYSAREAVVSYLQRRLEEGKPAILDEICHVAISLVRPEHAAEASGLKGYLNNEDNRVPEEFSVHKNTLKRKTRIKGDSGSWALQFERGALGDTENAMIYYNEEDDSLKIKGIPEPMKKQILKELSGRG